MKKKNIIISIVCVFIFIVFLVLMINKDKSLSYVDELDIVSNYVSEHTEEIITEKPVLGGTWYILSLNIDSINDTGNMVYEDGHIQGGLDFKYEIDEKLREITSLEVLN